MLGLEPIKTSTEADAVALAVPVSFMELTDVVLVAVAEAVTVSPDARGTEAPRASTIARSSMLDSYGLLQATDGCDRPAAVCTSCFRR